MLYTLCYESVFFHFTWLSCCHSYWLYYFIMPKQCCVFESKSVRKGSTNQNTFHNSPTVINTKRFKLWKFKVNKPWNVSSLRNTGCVKHFKETDSKDSSHRECHKLQSAKTHCPPIPILKRWDIICKWSTLYEYKKYFTWTLSVSSMSQDAQTGKWWKWNTFSGGLINLTNCKSAELVNYCQYEDNIRGGAD